MIDPFIPFLLVASFHAKPGYETLTPGVGLRHPSGPWGLVYRNSNGRASVAVGSMWREHVIYGVATGYGRPLTPIAGLTARVGPVRGTILPPWRDSPVTLTVSYEF